MKACTRVKIGLSLKTCPLGTLGPFSPLLKSGPDVARNARENANSE